MADPTTGARLSTLLHALPLTPTRQRLEAGACLVRRGDPSDALYEVRRGTLEVDVGDPEAPFVVGTLEAGALVGEIGLIAASPRTATVRAVGPAEVVCWPLSALREHLATDEDLDRSFVELARERLHTETLLRAFRGLAGPLDPETAALIGSRASWVRLERGATLFEEGEAGSAWFVLVSGRLSVHRTLEGRSREVAQVDAGTTVGEIAALAGGPRNATVRASRGSVLARFDAGTLKELDERLHRLVRAMATSLLRAQFVRHAERRTTSTRVALVPIASSSRTRAAIDALCTRAEPGLRTRVVTVAELRARGLLGDVVASSPTHPGWLRVRAWLEEVERDADLVLFRVERADEPVARAAAHLCDTVALVADAEADPRPGPGERALQASLRASPPVRTLLVRVHPRPTVEPRGTDRWLAHREGAGVHHLREGSAAHLARLHRHLARRPVVVVLGGGGPRGFAHLGVARALAEAGVPVDAICGTSAGGIFAAQLATERDHATLMELNRRSIAVRPFRRPTLPWMSFLSGRGFEQMGRIAFGDRRAEDLWIPYFCVATSLTSRRVVLLDRGELVGLTLATSALPGVLPPILARGELLVDGGVLDNLPCERARARWGGTVIAVPLGTEGELTYAGERLPSGLRAAAGRLGLGRRAPAPPHVGRLLARTVTVSGANAQIRSVATADVVIEPSVSHIRMTDLDRIEEIEDAGYRGALATLSAVADRIPREPPAPPRSAS